jgi:4-aminobutyrate aminotransferase
MTSAGNPICVAAGLAALEVIIGDDLAGKAARAGQRIRDQFLKEVERLGIQDVVGEIRGHGLAIGIDLVTDLESLSRDADLARKTIYRAWELGVVIYYVGSNVLEVTPPLTIQDSEIDRGVAIIAQAIADAKNGLVSDEQISAYAGW